MWMKARWMERKVDCSTGVYADAIIKMHLVESGRAEEAMQIVNKQSKRLTEHLQRSKLKQNQDKKELVPFLPGQQEGNEGAAGEASSGTRKSHGQGEASWREAIVQCLECS